MDQGGSLLDDLGSNHFTRAAPCCEAVKNHKGLLVVHGGIKVGLATIRIASAAVTNHDVAYVARKATGRNLRHKVVDALLLFAHFCGV